MSPSSSFIVKWMLFSAIGLLAFTAPSLASPILTFEGTGSDVALSFQFVSPVTLDTPGLQTTFGFNYCNVPTGESCDQVNFSAGSGVLRFVGIVTSGLDIRTFEFDNYINNGDYSTLGGSPNSGELVVTGSTDAAPEPSSFAFAGLGIFLLAVCIATARGSKSFAWRA